LDLGIDRLTLPLRDASKVQAVYEMKYYLKQAFTFLDSCHFNFKPLLKHMANDDNGENEQPEEDDEEDEEESDEEQKPKRCLIHCSAGVSRSVTVLTAYLMHKVGWTLRQTFQYVRSKRSYAYPNLGFGGCCWKCRRRRRKKTEMTA